MFGNDNNLQPSKIPQRAPQESGHEYLDPTPSEMLPKENDPGTQGKLNPASMTSKQLAGFLSQFYLIRTPYGYILGRHNPTSSTTSISRRSMQPPKPRLKDHYGEFWFAVVRGVSSSLRSIVKRVYVKLDNQTSCHLPQSLSSHLLFVSSTPNTYL